MRKFKIGDVVAFKRNCKTSSAVIKRGDIGLIDIDDFFNDGLYSVEIDKRIWLKCTPDELLYIGELDTLKELTYRGEIR